MTPPQTPMMTHEPWQIDATLLDVAVMTIIGQRVRPWLTVVANDAGAVIMFRITLVAPNNALLQSMCAEAELVDAGKCTTRDQPVTHVIESASMSLPTRLKSGMERVFARINRALADVPLGRPQAAYDLERLSHRIKQILKEL